jgi:hypothetical protein
MTWLWRHNSGTFLSGGIAPMPKPSLYDEAFQRVAEQQVRVAALAQDYKPPAWPFEVERVIERIRVGTPDEIRAAERVHFQQALAAFEKARKIEGRRSLVWCALGVVYFVGCAFTALLWFDALRWGWRLEWGGDATWRGIAFVFFSVSLFLTVAWWVVESPPAERFIAALVGDAEQWYSVGNGHLEVARAASDQIV